MTDTTQRCSDSTRLEGTESCTRLTPHCQAALGCSDSTRLEGTERPLHSPIRALSTRLQRLDPLGGY